MGRWLGILISLVALGGCATSPSRDESSSTAPPLRVPSAAHRGATIPRVTPAPNRAAAPSEPQRAIPSVVPVQELSGRVVSVNPGLQFVVIDFSLEGLPEIGQRMNIYRNSKKIGEVVITGPSSGTDLVADIVSGAIQVGDRAGTAPAPE